MKIRYYKAQLKEAANFIFYHNSVFRALTGLNARDLEKEMLIGALRHARSNAKLIEQGKFDECVTGTTTGGYHILFSYHVEYDPDVIEVEFLVDASIGQSEYERIEQDL